jgi:preprotein translocase subunit YajC
MGNMLTLASAGHLAAAQPTGGGGGSYTFLIIIVVLFALFYFVMIRPQRNRQRQVQQMQNQIRPGQRIRTTAGMYATVTAVEGDDVILELSPGVTARFMRRAIMDVVSGESGPEESAPAAAAAEDGGEPRDGGPEAAPASEAPAAGTASAPAAGAAGEDGKTAS